MNREQMEKVDRIIAEAGEKGMSQELSEKLDRMIEEAERRHNLEVCKAAMRIAKRTREELEEKRRGKR